MSAPGPGVAVLPLNTPSVVTAGVPPGDPGAVQAAARQFAGMVTALDAEASRVESIAGSLRPTWRGVAELAFATSAAKVVANCRTAAGAFRDTSLVLNEYATELQAAQELARQALTRAAAIDAASARLQLSYSDAQAQARAEVAAGRPADSAPLVALRSQADSLQVDAAGARAQSAAAAEQARVAAARAAAALEGIALRAAAATPGMAGRLAHDGTGFLFTNQKWIRTGLALLAPGGVLAKGLAGSIGGNYLVRDGRYVRVFGSRFAGDDLLSKFLRSGRVLSPGRYLADNPEVARYIDPLAAGSRSFRNVFDATSPGFMREIPRGGGALAGALTFGADAYDFSPWGTHSSQGVLSTDFAATVTVDGGLLAGTTVASSAAGTFAASAIAGGAAGSVVPGLGTAIGFGVGLGIGLLMTTDAGQSVRRTLISGTKTGMDFAVQHPSVLAATPLAPLATGLEIYNHRDDIASVAVGTVHVAGDVGSGILHAPGLVAGGLSSAKDGAGKLLDKVF